MTMGVGGGSGEVMIQSADFLTCGVVLDGAHVAGGLESNQDAAPGRSSLSLSALLFRRPASEDGLD